MTTPPRITELKYPQCSTVHWEVDRDYRGVAGEEEPYKTRVYSCPHYGPRLPVFDVLRQSPPEFLSQPRDLHPMTRKGFKYWLEILKTEFPDHPRLSKPGRRFSPRTPRQAHTRLPAVVEMTDEVSSKSVEPQFETAVEWLELMSEPGACLEFSHKNGGKIKVTLTAEGTFDAVSRNSRGRIRKDCSGLD